MLSLESNEVWSYGRLCEEYEAFAQNAGFEIWDVTRISKIELMRCLTEMMARPLDVRSMRWALNSTTRYLAGGRFHRTVQQVVGATVLYLQFWHYGARARALTRTSCYQALARSGMQVTAEQIERFEVIMCDVVGLGPDSIRNGSPAFAPPPPALFQVFTVFRQILVQTPQILSLQTVMVGCDGFNHAELMVMEVTSLTAKGRVLESHEKRGSLTRCDRTCRVTDTIPTPYSFTLP